VILFSDYCDVLLQVTGLVLIADFDSYFSSFIAWDDRHEQVPTEKRDRACQTIGNRQHQSGGREWHKTLFSTSLANENAQQAGVFFRAKYEAFSA